MSAGSNINHSRGAGATLFAYCLDIFLYGVLTVQTYSYYLAFPDDKRLTKAIVYFVYMVGTIQTAFALHDFYALFCIPRGPGEIGSFGTDSRQFGFMWITIPISSALVAIVVQLLYAYRIYTLSRQKLVTAVVSLMAVVEFVCGIYMAATVYAPSKFVGDRAAITLGAYINAMVWGLIGALCDIVIAMYMFIFLSKQSRKRFQFTQAPLTRLKRLLIETGMLTAAMTIVYMLTSSNKLLLSENWYLIPGLSLSKFYANSMLVLFNNRFTISGGRDGMYSSSFSSDDSAGRIFSHGIAFANSYQMETTSTSGDVHTIELTARLNRDLEGVHDPKF